MQDWSSNMGCSIHGDSPAVVISWLLHARAHKNKIRFAQGSSPFNELDFHRSVPQLAVS